LLIASKEYQASVEDGLYAWSCDETQKPVIGTLLQANSESTCLKKPRCCAANGFYILLKMTMHRLQWNATWYHDIMTSGFVTMRRMEAMLYGVRNKLNIWRKHNDEKTLKRILDDGAK